MQFGAGKSKQSGYVFVFLSIPLTFFLAALLGYLSERFKIDIGEQAFGIAVVLIVLAPVLTFAILNRHYKTRL